MQLTSKTFKSIAVATVLAVGLGGATLASAKTTTLVAGTWMPPSNPMNTVVWPTWAKWVEEATEGRVQVKIEYDVGHPKSYYQLVEDGVIDAGWSFSGYLPGRFTLPIIVEQPGLNANAEAASVALWKTYQKHFTQANEYEGLELIAQLTHGPGQIHTREPITSLKDLRNKRIRIGGGVQAEIAKRMGVTGVSAAGPQVYELLQQGVIDGVFMPAQEQSSLKLDEVAPNLILIPGGLYMGNFSMFISPDFMDSLDPKDAAAIRSVSGEKLSALAGKAWDQADVDGIKYAREKGVNIVELGPNDTITKEFREIAKGLEEVWIKNARGKKGVNPEQALKDLREFARTYQPAN